MKFCTQCGIEKELKEFRPHNKAKDGRQSHCRKCADIFRQKWAKNNPEKIAEYESRWQKKNRKKLSEYAKKWQREAYKSLKHKLNHNMRYSIWFSLKGTKSNRSWLSLVSYTLDDLIKHLQKTIPNGYTWQDYIDGKLHVDHKIPISVFNFTSAKNIDFRRCWALSNLQLLPAKINLQKHNKLTEPFQPSLAF